MTASTQWKAQKERSSPRSLALIVWIALHLGRRCTRLLLWPIVAYFFVSGASARNASRAYLARVLPRPVRQRDVFQHLHSFAACTLDRVYLLAGRHGELDVSIHDPGNALAPLHAGSAAIVLTAHLGSFDLLRALGAQQTQLRFRVVMDRAHGRMLSATLARLNPESDEQIINTSNGPQLVLALRDALAEGSVVGLMADRRVGADPGLAVEFLGAQARLPSGPWSLAAAFAHPALICFGLYRGGRRYELHFETFPAPAFTTRAERAMQAQASAQRFADRLAHYVRLAPYNWFNFYDFWADDAQARGDAPSATATTDARAE